MDEEIRRLYEQTALTRYQFLTAELQTCFTAVDFGMYELSVGRTDVAQNEVAAVEKGIRVLQRFLPDVSQPQRAEVEARLAELQSQLGSLKEQLE